MKRHILLITALLLIHTTACSLGGGSTPTEAPAPVDENRCGDGVCSGPENPENCPEDCPKEASESEPAEPAEPAESDASSTACGTPNPHRAIVSEELLAYENFLENGSFEEGERNIVIQKPHQGDLELAKVERSPEAARTGSWGYALTAGPGEGSLFGVKGYHEKGEDLRFSAWLRSPQGETTATPLVFWFDDESNLGNPDMGKTFTVGPDWTQVSFTTSTTQGAKHALLAFEVGPNTTLHVDDATFEFPVWDMAEYEGESQVVGGVTVPPEPAAVTHLNFIIHIEDPNALHLQPYFESQTTIFTELARIFHSHGGFLTIQPEQDWPEAAEAGFHPGLLAELNQKYGVQYSNHTHGPNCLDPQGIPRSAADCNSHHDWEKNFTDEDVLTYAQNMRQLFESASGIPVTDHNGNFDFTATSRLAEVGIQTMSSFKIKYTQRTYDVLINNPWRPGQGNALEDLDNFLTHDPETGIIYVPGWGQALTRHPERAAARIRPMLSQFILYADPDRVNSFYVILHVGHFYSRTGDRNYLLYDEESGQVTQSAEFQAHLQAWDDLLGEVIDPLMEAGYLQWTSIPEIGQLYQAWEATCHEQ